MEKVVATTATVLVRFAELDRLSFSLCGVIAEVAKKAKIGNEGALREHPINRDTLEVNLGGDGRGHANGCFVL